VICVIEPAPFDMTPVKPKKVQMPQQVSDVYFINQTSQL